MCGILISVRSCNQDAPDPGFSKLFSMLKVMNAARGPDAQCHHHIDLPPGEPIHDATLIGAGTLSSFTALDIFASELRVRGPLPVVQPHTRDGDLLCWNGEVSAAICTFQIFEGIDISPQENDGSRLLEKLIMLETANQVRDLFGTIEGPYAFVYYQARHRRLFFARDPLGRRSLLLHRQTNPPQLILASVSAGHDPVYQFDELGTNHIYCLDLTRSLEIEDGLLLIPRNSCQPETSIWPPFATPRKLNQEVPCFEGLSRAKSLLSIPQYLVGPVDDFIYHLDRSVKLRTENIPIIPSECKARVAVLFSGGIDSAIIAFLAHRYIPIDEPIDLLNVAFENPTKIKTRLRCNVDDLNDKKRQRWEESLDVNRSSEIDLYQLYMVPDRETGLQQVEEFRRLCPGRTWNFVEINVPYTESQRTRTTIETLMFPRRTVMDMSLALALYFASRGRGQVQSFPGAESHPYTSTARVLLSGLGSDELLGGYRRHRTTYQTNGWRALIEELQLELDRIPTRNLGRDDRVTSSHGKETRYPFLSLALVNFLAGLPVHCKVDLELDAGVGDKLLLRLAARKLGLIGACERKKRAMQFGSQSARLEGERMGDVLLNL